MLQCIHQWQFMYFMSNVNAADSALRKDCSINKPVNQLSLKPPCRYIGSLKADCLQYNSRPTTAMGLAAQDTVGVNFVTDWLAGVPLRNVRVLEYVEAGCGRCFPGAVRVPRQNAVLTGSVLVTEGRRALHYPGV